MCSNHDCFNGLIYTWTNSVGQEIVDYDHPQPCTDCRKEETKKLTLAALPPRILAVPGSIISAQFIVDQINARHLLGEQIKFMYMAGSILDIYSAAKCMALYIGLSGVGDMVLTSDSELISKSFEPTQEVEKGQDLMPSPFDQLVECPKFLLIELGAQSTPHKLAAGMLEKAIHNRVARNKYTWIMSNSARPWGESSPSYSPAVESELTASFTFMRAPPCSVDVRPSVAGSFIQRNGSRPVPSSQPATRPTYVAPNTPPAPKALFVATRSGKCSVCGRKVIMGDTVAPSRPDGNGRAQYRHPECTPVYDALPV